MQPVVLLDPRKVPLVAQPQVQGEPGRRLPIVHEEGRPFVRGAVVRPHVGRTAGRPRNREQEIAEGLAGGEPVEVEGSELPAWRNRKPGLGGMLRVDTDFEAVASAVPTEVVYHVPVVLDVAAR